MDPLAQVWLAAARRIGLRVVRTPDAYAATDGRGTLAVGTDATLDADDSLAQMIFHELCHSLVEGEASFRAPDWGMDNTGPDHDWREHACLRTQWVLAGLYGLRGVFAPTTDFRALWDTFSGAAGGDVLADRADRSTRAAIAAIRRADHPPWAPALHEALAATAKIAAVVAPAAQAPSLWALAQPAPALHPTGLPAGAAAGTCGDCAWRYSARGAERCRQASDARVRAAWPACARYEAAASVDCQTCGACCREAYHAVHVSRRDPAVKLQPAFIVQRDGGQLEVRRSGDRCAALAGGEPEPAAPERSTRYHCTIYSDRPRTCREFTLGSDHCLTARRRVGLSL